MVELREIFNDESYLIITNKRIIKNNTVGRVDENIIVFSVSDDSDIDIDSYVIIVAEGFKCFVCKVLKKLQLEKRILIISKLEEVEL